MLTKEHIFVILLVFLLAISIYQKIKPKKEGLSNKEKDVKKEQLNEINDTIEKDIERLKNSLNIDKYKEDYINLLIELEEDIGNKAVSNLYDKTLNKSTRSYHLQQEGLNNLARYLKNYKE